ncbi:Lrp/AsnC family transcriptional regulator [Pseudomonas sp. B21-032]|uniref:siroheme decarboxylase n=1 Tax=Pseudomonas vranovensis TaxID=321661 RepID=A0A423DR01_9PSED|nr:MULTISPECIES: Lrp/AsnC family transcriptional regulator [Pseudomonas]ROL73970.1 AsnC family protein [Pseudomonas vranovensis]UVL59493.1 Lrp/AsnC family transcriptional regulator [Pseudomonas sp. B21-032]
MPLTTLEQCLIEHYQHGMPICAEPYREMARVLDCSEEQVIACLQQMAARGSLSRIGPVFEHRHAGASTLAALAVPAERLQQVAERVSQYPEVNHNYAREHHYNLWFVLTGPDRPHLQRILDELQADTGLVPLDLPMLTAYRIDLGFALGDAP